SMNVTLPTSASRAGATGLTVAVSVTAWPVTDGLRLDVSVVEGAGGTKTLPVTEKRLVSTISMPGPPTFGPSMRNTFVANGLPVIVCAVAKSPMNPVGGTDVADAESHVRNGPTLVLARTSEKSHAVGVASHP